MKNKSLNSIYDNYINGNTADAKRKAQRVSLHGLMEHLTQYEGWEVGNAYEVARFLKGADNHQAACDATADQMNCH